MAMRIDDLRESNEFLNLLLSNINSAVLIVDEDLQIHQFNDFFVELFDRSLDTFVEKSFGRVAGCVNAVVENKPCGKTSKCGHCILRRSLIQTLLEEVPADKKTLDRVFYVDGRARLKHLEFSTRPISYQGEKLILVILYDVTDIEEKKIELERKQQQIDQDLEAAAGIQQSLLPGSLPDIPGIDMAWRFEPCQRIGGDIFNIQVLDKTNVGLYMLDVCGHGVSSALISVSISQFLQSMRDHLPIEAQVLTPDTILKNLNLAFPFERFESYFSIIYTAIDLVQGILTYSCAGHPPLFFISADGKIEVLGSNGPVIGLSENQSYGNTVKQMYAGDKIILYTDGIIECRNRQGEMFGKKRLLDILGSHSHESAQNIVDAVYARSKSFMDGGQPDDDLSIMVVEYTGKLR